MHRFSEQQRALLLSVARTALINCLLHEQPPNAAAQAAVDAALAAHPELDTDMLLEPRACFVTLWQGEHGNLRGCRGEFTPHQPLIGAVAEMALATALDDPRFAPVTAAEVPQLRIEISVLSPLEPIRPEEIEIGRHGLLIARGRQRGLLLPSVPVEHHMDVETFLDALCWKAGLREGSWRDPETALWGFETEAWEEP
jgi:AmmeMemoRadiSam system protein A